jgi:hypothetical protein
LKKPVWAADFDRPNGFFVVRGARRHPGKSPRNYRAPAGTQGQGCGEERSPVPERHKRFSINLSQKTSQEIHNGEPRHIRVNYDFGKLKISQYSLANQFLEYSETPMLPHVPIYDVGDDSAFFALNKVKRLTFVRAFSQPFRGNDEII